ncbi:hypothetical protein PACTADRAFT_32434 [Pachysolen tannophilus NRRL Y-2460]|uniref:Uncharacterized protein n=1 Tax=Pachysolen tannophilus NRRL Y-2460 TaxID=669874 RepID=A0A1E4TYW8_PACTA|nr:hypothetical protein PACTADRAFT_32434 [Pachysolen tannophilus NRRL Y-2460]
MNLSDNNADLIARLASGFTPNVEQETEQEIGNIIVSNGASTDEFNGFSPFPGVVDDSEEGSIPRLLKSDIEKYMIKTENHLEAGVRNYDEEINDLNFSKFCELQDSNEVKFKLDQNKDKKQKKKKKLKSIVPLSIISLITEKNINKPLCEICEYEHVFGSKPIQMIRWYEKNFEYGSKKN